MTAAVLGAVLALVLKNRIKSFSEKWKTPRDRMKVCYNKFIKIEAQW